MEYEEEEMLMLSGIQHYAFCPRQWALIHIDQQWDDNRLTAEGQILHQHVDDPFYRQKMGDIICLRSVSIASKRLGLYGFTDVVELYPTDSSVNAITHPFYPGYWKPFPIEYKHGKPKSDHIDSVQLTAQAMCLEEQYGITISKGALYYGETKHREEISFDNSLRCEVLNMAISMHEVYDDGKLPQTERSAHCKNCSLKDKCMPETSSLTSASDYLKMNLYEETS